MTTLAVTVVGDDRPGIVAAVTAALAVAGVNLEDTSMTILRGHFVMTLVVDAQPGTNVERALASEADRLGLDVTVREVSALEPPAPEGTHHVLTLHGADRPGIVSRVSAVLAAAHGNVTDLTTRLVGGLYVLTCELDLPPSADAEALAEDLAAAAADLGVAASLHDADADLL